MSRATKTRLDALLAAGTAGATLLLLAHGGLPLTRPRVPGVDTLAVLLAVCSAAPLLAWRRAPMSVFIAATAASALQAGLGYDPGLPLAPGVALYLLAASRDRGRQWRLADTIIVLVGLSGFLAATGFAGHRFPDAELVHSSLGWAVGWFAGERSRLRRMQIDHLHERAARAEHQAQDNRRLAVAEERARIARDLHDAAGHAINVIAVRASAGRLRFEQEPQRARAALEAIEEVARQTAAEIDQIVHALRDADPGEAAPVTPPGLASVQTLVNHHAAAGLDVTLDLAQDPPPPLNPAADQAAYRILQEALTNAARHGSGSACISLTFARDALEVTVTNPVTATLGAEPARGHGLIGMRERATLLGGSIETGRVNGTFRVRAVLPYGREEVQQP